MDLVHVRPRAARKIHDAALPSLCDSIAARGMSETGGGTWDTPCGFPVSRLPPRTCNNQSVCVSGGAFPAQYHRLTRLLICHAQLGDA